MSKPLVTILIDTYNHERFIEQAVVSVLDQDFPAADMEILVVDDGSTDRTPDILRKFAPRVRVLRKANGGQASAFNAGIAEAHGALVAFLDGDDWWKPQKLSRVVEALSADPALGIVGHGIVLVQQSGAEQTETLREGFRFQANTPEGARLFRVRRSFLGTSRMTIRAELLRKIGQIPQAIAIEADEYLFTLAAVLAPAQILPEALTNYRLHDANLYQMSEVDPVRIRRKHAAMASLAGALAKELERHDVPERARRILTTVVRAETDQLRLSLGDGSRWETARTEWVIYRTFHPDASLLHRAFKLLTLLPALAFPPSTFYRVRRELAGSDLYLRARSRLLPIPGMTHINKELNLRPRG